MRKLVLRMYEPTSTPPAEQGPAAPEGTTADAEASRARGPPGGAGDASAATPTGPRPDPAALASAVLATLGSQPSMTPQTPGQAGEPPPSGAAPGAEGQGPAPQETTLPATPALKVKLSTLTDVTNEAELVPIGRDDVKTMFERYASARGGYPHADIEPTAHQLAAFKQTRLRPPLRG